MLPVTKASEAAIRDAGRILRDGGLVAMPTETVYGLAGDATNARAVAGIYAAKQRPSFNPLIVHVENLERALGIGIFPDTALKLARAFWPGPLTIVVPRRPGSGIADIVTAGLDSVAIRMPAHPVARALVAAADRPLAAPSANRSGRLSPTRAADVAADLGGDVAMVIDGGACRHGVESTVIDATGKRLTLLRPGAVTAEAIAAIIGEPPARGSHVSARPNAPGQLESHYAPNARVRLEASSTEPGEALLAFGDDVPATTGPVLNLSPSGDLVEAAANLFAHLRALDATGARTIAVMPIPTHGLGEAINDRLRRAAAPR